MTTESAIHFHPFVLDVANQQLLRGGRRVPITPKAYDVLYHLVTQAGRLATKSELLEAVWRGTHVQEAVLKVCIREIRKALRDPARAPRFIETAHRRGYRFIAPIARAGRTRPDGAPRSLCVGRESEGAQLSAALERAVAGERQMVLVTGEAGIGKTAVVETFLDRAATHPSLRVACGACQEQFGAGEAYLPVLEALGRLSRGADGAGLAALLRRHAPTWLAQMPALLGEEDREALRREIIGATRERMLREMAEAMEALATEAPVVLVLEDLHWADFSTLDLIASLARRREPARLLLIGTYRPADVPHGHHPLEAIKQELVMRQRCVEIRVDYLSRPAVVEYLAMRFPGARIPDRIAAAIHRRSGGNPLFMANVVDFLVSRRLLGGRVGAPGLRTVLREVETGMPENLRQMIDLQVERLPAADRALLEAAAVAGIDFSPVAVAAGMEGEAGGAEEACEALARRDCFLRPAGSRPLPDGTLSARYAFIHPLYQNVLYQRIRPARRLLLHQRIADRGIAVYGDRVGEIAGELAVHLEQARDYRGAIRHLCAAAGNAARRFANREAIAHLTRAFGLVSHLPAAERPPLQTTILEHVGMARRSLGDAQGAADDFEALVELAREQGRQDVEARGLFYLGSVLSWFDRARFAAAAVEAGDLGGRLRDDLLRAHARGYAAYWNLLLRGPRPGESEAPEEAIAAARRAGDRLLLGQHLVRAAYFRCLRSEYRSGCAAAREGIKLALEAGDGFDYLLGHFFLAWGLVHCGEWGEALQVLAQGTRTAERNGHRLWTALLQLEEALLHAKASHFETALRLCERGLKAAKDADHPHSRTLGQVILGFALLGLGHPERARHSLGELADPRVREQALMDCNWRLPLGFCVGAIDLALGDRAGARAEADRVVALAEEAGERNYRALGGMLRALVSEAAGDLRGAIEEITAALASIDGVEAPVAEWRVSAAAARLHAAAGQPAEASACRSRSARAIDRIAGSLAPIPELRRAFLRSPAVLEITEGRLDRPDQRS